MATIDNIKQAQKEHKEESEILAWMFTWNEADYRWALDNLDSTDWYYKDFFVFMALLALANEY